MEDNVIPSDEKQESPLSPEPTKYSTLCNFLCISLNKVKTDSSQKYFLNHWEVSLTMPIIVIGAAILSYIYYLKQTKFFEQSHFIFGIFTTIFLILFLISYVLVIFESPGYLPFYYPQKNMIIPYEYLSGYVSNKQQKQYVKQLSLPNNAEYCPYSGRIVIRPDHFCGWTTSYIGKKNHKLFFHFNLWGFLYITNIMIHNLISITKKGFVENIPMIVGCVLLFMFGFTFWLLTMIFIFLTISDFNNNKTDLKRYKKKSCIENWEVVCGPKEEWLKWLLPIPPFHGIDGYSLVSPQNEEEPFL